MADASPGHPQAIAAALGVLDRHIAALNARDAAAADTTFSALPPRRRAHADLEECGQLS